MNRNLRGNFKAENSTIFVGNSFRKQSRDMLIVLFMAFFVFFLNGKIWAQTDYSGVYYIASGGKGPQNGAVDYTYNSAAPENNYYLCPTEGWCYYAPVNDFTGTDNGKPFLTTYKCRDGVYDATKAVWTIEKDPNSGYYYIKQTISGRYMLANGQIRTTSNPDRVRVHLGVPDNPNMNYDDELEAYGLFDITPYPENNPRYLVIKAIGITDTNTPHAGHPDHKWFTVTNGNHPSLVGEAGKTGGPTGYGNVAGIIGIYTEDDISAPFYLEDAVQQPVISQTSNGDIIITCATNNTTIYYTLDGSTPVIPTDGAPDPTGPTYKYTGTFTPALGCEGVKAVAVLSNLHAVVSKMAEFSFSVYSTPTISFNSIDQVTISASHADAIIYYTTDGSDPIVGTSSIYSAPLTVTVATTIKAIATHTGYLTSDMATLVITQVATPTIQNNGSNAISITSATPGATIYYTTDGSTPTTSSNLYTSPLQENVSGVTIKAIAVKENMINSEVGSGSVTLQCAPPVITRVGLSFTLSCSMPTDAILYYTLDGGSEIEYSGAVTFTTDQLPMTVTAVARHSNYTQSETATFVLTNGNGTPGDPYMIYSNTDFSTFVTNVNNGTTASACYKLGTDVSASGTAAITTAFTGTFDGNSYTITDLTHPLFNIVNGGIVKNVTLKNVNISSSDAAVGAIAGTAKGYSRIYNCGILPNSADFPDGTHPTVTTTGSCAGGIVGNLEDDSRVINCYSYADVSATTYAAGIVGYNTFASTAAVSNGKYANLRTAIVNCMFYGDILGGTNQYGVYGGELITNATATGISSYNYYRKGSTFNAINGHPSTSGGENTFGEPTAYNCSFPAEERYLTQVEFHRSLLNSNRELCGWWVGSDVAPNTLTTAEVQAIPKNASLMYKWVVDPNLAPYPILKPFGKYPSIVNGNTGTPWFDRTTANPYEGKQLGTLTVTVKSGDHYSAADQTLILPITDMDTLHYDFGYCKVQLPYYNTVFGNPNGASWTEKYAGNYTNYVVTGWKVTAVDNAGSNSFEAHWEHGYNFADRKCTDKDLYSVSGRVFAQGGNYYVPDGVTAITIEAYWGEPIYVRNDGDSYDRVNITEGNTGYHFAPAGIRDNNVNGATIYTEKIRNVIDRIPQKKTIYDYAVVLVGNVQESNSNNAVINDTQATRGLTIMSVDLDFDEEPDYCLEWQLGTGVSRNTIAPIRFDFLPVVELGIAGKTHNSTYFFSLGCFRSYGHFEVTETSFIRFGQFEFELQTRDEGPVILNGGIYDQYCRGRNNESNQHINYVILGGHVVMPSFTPGAHVNNPAGVLQTRHCAVNALGGDFTSFYLTGGYNESITPYEDNPHCYIDGGRFGTIAAAYKEGIWGDVTWRINHALIGEFYGGGVMSQATGSNYKIVKGSIDVVIDNSIVRKYCGGPKFGNMEPGKTVTTSATGTVFTWYYGAGNGGSNYVQYDNTDHSMNCPPYDASTWSGIVDPRYHPGRYRSGDHSYEADYDYEVINTSTGTWAGNVVNRSYYYSAQFATTNTGNVTSTLTNCIVKKNFYGGGFLGGVTGSVNSTLTDTDVYGSAFGGGYSASVDTVVIHNKDKNIPVVNVYTAMITYNPEGTSNTYYWSHNHGSTTTPVTEASPATHDTAYFYTEVPLDHLGAVSINTTLTIEGSSTIGTYKNGVLKPNTGNVFGGGDESEVQGNTLVHIKDRTKVYGNVYGGGNMGTIGGDTKVIINGITP